MQVAQLHHELPRIPYVAVIVAFLPERTQLVPQVRVRLWGNAVPQVRVLLLDANLGNASAAQPFCERQLQVVNRLG